MLVISPATMPSDVMTRIIKTGDIELITQRLSDIVPNHGQIYDMDSDT